MCAFNSSTPFETSFAISFEKKIAEKACAIYAQLGKTAREAFVNQLEGMAFVLESQRREEKPDEEKKEAS